MCAGSFGEHPDREFERHVAMSDEVAEEEARRDRMADHTPAMMWGALETPKPLTAFEERELRVDAVAAVIWERLEERLDLARAADEAWVRELAEEFVAAADTGI